MRKYCGCDYAVDHIVDGVKSRFSCSHLLYHEYRPVSKFRANKTKVLLRKNIALSFEDTEQKETCVCRVYPEKGGGTKRQANLLRLHNIVLTVTLS